jgi:DNA-binding transcriptional ArsR family regulator
VVAEAEVALASRDLGWAAKTLATARSTLEAHGDRVNAAHASSLQARHLLLAGRLEEAESLLAGIDPAPLPSASRAAHALLLAGIAMRGIRSKAARAALGRADDAAREAGIPALRAEVEKALGMLSTPVARSIVRGSERPLLLEEVEALFASGALVIDACRHAVRGGGKVISLATRPVLFALTRMLGEAWPGDVPRDALIARVFRLRLADESHRARLRVEMARLRAVLRPLAEISATGRGFLLVPAAREIVVLAQPVEEKHAALLACLADGESWSTSALAMGLRTSQRTVQRALDALAAAGKVQSFGRGRSRRWLLPPVPGFATSLLLPPPLPVE